jgi:hypothetical protein
VHLHPSFAHNPASLLLFISEENSVALPRPLCHRTCSQSEKSLQQYDALAGQHRLNRSYRCCAEALEGQLLQATLRNNTLVAEEQELLETLMSAQQQPVLRSPMLQLDPAALATACITRAPQTLTHTA